MHEDLTSIEVIGMAVRSEEDASKFYAHIAKMIGNPMVRAKYELLAKEEVNHGIMLTNLYKEMLKTTEKPPRIPGNPSTAERGGIPEDISSSLEELLKLAIQREIKAKEFYLMAAQKASDPSGKKLLTYLAGVEEGHEAMLTLELKSYMQDQSWYTEDVEATMIHVGP